jgi:hypothetical protein
MNVAGLSIAENLACTRSASSKRRAVSIESSSGVQEDMERPKDDTAIHSSSKWRSMPWPTSSTDTRGHPNPAG